MVIKYKHYSLFVVTFMLSILLLTSGSLVVVDPLQLFHKPWVRDNYYINELRFQAAGIINHDDFDSIILGTSFAANFSAEEASDIWNTKFVNISPSGSWLSERSVILNYALSKKALKHVVMSLDGFDMSMNQKLTFPISNYDFLYNQSRLDDLKIYSNEKYLDYLLCENVIFVETACESTKSLEMVAEWGSDIEESRRFGGLENWFKAIDNGQVKQGLISIAKNTRAIKNGEVKNLDKTEIEKRLKAQEASFERYLLPHLKQNPNTSFHLFFPPVSRMLQGYKIQVRPDDFDLYLDRIRYVIRVVEALPNVKVYAFDNLEFTNNIDLYKDSVHYSGEINSAILMWMRHEYYQLNRDNVEQYIDVTSQLARNFDTVAFGEQIISFLQENALF